MTKVERLLINKGHYLDDTYHLVMDIVKVAYNLKDNVAERLDDDLSDDAYAMCEEMLTAVYGRSHRGYCRTYGGKGCKSVEAGQM